MIRITLISALCLSLAACSPEQRADVETIIGNLTGTTTTQQTGSLVIAPKTADIAIPISSEPPAVVADAIPEPVIEPPAPVKTWTDPECRPIFRVDPNPCRLDGEYPY